MLYVGDQILAARFAQTDVRVFFMKEGQMQRLRRYGRRLLYQGRLILVNFYPNGEDL